MEGPRLIARTRVADSGWRKAWLWQLAAWCLLFGSTSPAPGASYTVTVDGSQKYQVMDGFGVNANHRSWTNNELQPVLDALIDQGGITQFRVIYDRSDWEATNDNSDPDVMNWNYYNTIYSGPDFQSLWGIIGYLDQRGMSNGIMLNFMGGGPAWMGGATLTPGYEDEYAEMIASLLVYARSNQNLGFKLVGPVNEPDIPPMGIATASQYVTVLHDLALKLDANGIGDIRLVGPDLGNADYTGLAGTNWVPDIMADPVVMAHWGAFVMHSYMADGGNSVGVSDLIQSSAYPNAHFWMTEFNVPCWTCLQGFGGTNSWGYSRMTVEYLLAQLANGASSAFLYEGYDTYFAGTDPGWSYYGLFAVDDPNATPKTYHPRQQFYTYSQVTKYVGPGAQRIGVSGAGAPLILLGFYNTNSGQLTLTGVNQEADQAQISATLTSLPALTNLELIYTSAGTNLADGGPVPVTNGVFAVSVPPDCVFTLVGGGRQSAVSAALTNPAGGSSFAAPADILLQAGVSTLTGAISSVRFLSGPTNLATIAAPPYRFLWTNVHPGYYSLSATASNTLGNGAVSAPVDISVFGPVAQVKVTPTNAEVAPQGQTQFSASANDTLGIVIVPPPAFSWSAGAGAISSNGLYTAGGGAGGPFAITAAAGIATGTASVTIDSNANLAALGTGLAWYGMQSDTAHAPQAPAPGLNDGDLTTDLPLEPSGAEDSFQAYEAAGIVWATPQTVRRVGFWNGSYLPNGDGVFSAAFALQFSADGVTWTNAGTDWSVVPAYIYNSPTSGGTNFTFTGGPVSVLGVRCVGQVHSTSDISISWLENATEVQAFSTPFPPPPTLGAATGGGGVTLTWDASGANYVLESSASVTPPAVWSPLTNAPQLNLGQWSVTITPQAPQHFFRLRQQ
jgi:hypothetical protein